MIADELKDENRALSRREAQLEQLKRETSGLPRKEDLARQEIRLGVDPKYVAMRYDIDLERCLRYAEAIRKQREEQQLRTAAATGGV